MRYSTYIIAICFGRSISLPAGMRQLGKVFYSSNWLSVDPVVKKLLCDIHCLSIYSQKGKQ